MELSKNQKVLLGILHFLPIIGIITYIVYFFSFIFGTIMEAEMNGSEPDPQQFLGGFIIVFIIFMVSILLAIGIKIFDIIHLVKNNRNDTGNKVLIWILLFVFVGTIAEIIYFFMEIMPDKKQEKTELQNTQGQ